MQRPPEDPTLTATALTLAARGWHVFPVRPGDKRPAVHGHDHCPATGTCSDGHQGWEQRATTDPERIAKCWGAGAFNIGIATGPSGLVVVDLDIPKPGGKNAPPEWQLPGVVCGEDVLAVLADRAGYSYAALLNTFTVRTGRGGLHLYYMAPSGVELHNTNGSNGGLGWLIDTRAVGGYVVAPGSTVAGGSYETVYDTTPAPLPAWITDTLTEADGPAASVDPGRAWAIVRSGAQRRTAYANTALTAEVTRVLNTAEGGRNEALVRAAFALGQLVGDGLLPEPVVTDALSAAGQAVGLPARECAATIRSGLRSGMTRPRGGVA